MTLPDFPITSYIPQICQTLNDSKSHCLILTAETGAGKSTILPLGLLEYFKSEEKILMTEPRRIAVLGVANRISELLNQDCGQTVGYKIHLEKKMSKNTRLEVMSEAILVKMMQENPTLEGYKLVILDEAHERSVNFDLALAFLKEALLFRDDLYIIIMSATIDCKKISDFFNQAPVLNVPGRTFPVKVIYDDTITVEKAILREIKNEMIVGRNLNSEKNCKNQTDCKSLNQKNGNVLVFLPGISEIKKCHENLTNILSESELEKNDVEIKILHSSINISEQKKILVPSTKKRVILASSIAETSLTIPGVTTVIDSGLSRISKININTGMESLVTEKESAFSAEQRKGRAGREQDGKCIRLWNELDKRPKEIPPEILRADLCHLVLECAERGVLNVNQIQWLDSPSQAEWNESTKLLQKLDFISDSKKITAKGKIALTLGIPPRLANIAIEGYKIAAKTKNETNVNRLLIKYGDYEKSSVAVQNQFIEDLHKRLKNADFNGFQAQFENENLLILAGFPDRLAKRISTAGEKKNEFQFANGRKAFFIEPENSKIHLSAKTEWIVAPEVLANQGEAKIFDFIEMDSTEIKNWIQPQLKTEISCEFMNGKIKKCENLCYDKIVVSSKQIENSSEDYKSAWENEISKKGIEALPLNQKTIDFLQRAKFYFQQKNQDDESWENASGSFSQNNLEKNLQASVKEWLLPFITGNSVSAQNVYDGLFWLLNGNQIEKEVPQFLILENGVKSKVKYELLSSPDDKTKLVLRPVLEIIVQRIFGCKTTPKICGMNVLLRLLSPASRPLQITDDLENFWVNSWPEICKEMKGRYPKHNWDYKKFI